MDAPIYPPSTAYEQPQQVPEPMTTAGSSFAAFLADERAKAILFEEAPGAKFLVGTAKLRPHLGNMSPQSVSEFGAITEAQVERIDARLKVAGIMVGAVK